MIVGCKEWVVLWADDSKDVLMFDPKTACTNPKYKDQQVMGCAAYYQEAQQLMMAHKGNSFVNVWDVGNQRPVLKASTKDKVTAMVIKGDLLLLGMNDGSVCVHELPSGILLRRLPVHPAPILSLCMSDNGYLYVCTSQHLSVHTIQQVLCTSAPNPLASLSSTLPIIGLHLLSNIVILATEQALNFYTPDNLHSHPHLQPISLKSPITCICSSRVSVFVGDVTGRVRQYCLHQQMHLEYQEQKLTLSQKQHKQYDLKKPLTCMVYVESLGRLVCGNCDGEVKVVSDGGVKNSLTLFKCAVRSMIVIGKPDVHRSVPQQAKIKALHKYELNSLDSPIMYKQSEEYAHQMHNIQVEPPLQSQATTENQYLDTMLEYLSEPAQMLETELCLLKEQNKSLVQANLQYAKMLSNQFGE